MGHQRRGEEPEGGNTHTSWSSNVSTLAGSTAARSMSLADERFSSAYCSGRVGTNVSSLAAAIAAKSLDSMREGAMKEEGEPREGRGDYIWGRLLL